MPKRVTSEAYIARARAVHGDKYDYSRTVYKNMHAKVIVVCPIHGSFVQEAQAHINGQGCPACGKVKQKQTLFDRYGVDNPMKNSGICTKARQTCLERYGTEWAMSTDTVREKVYATNRERYGVEHPSQNKEIQEKIANTLVARYGVSNPSQVDSFREKARLTCLARYGSEEPLASESVRGKIKATCLERYQGPAPMSSSEVRQKCEETVFGRYRVKHISQMTSVINKIRATKAENHTFSSSDSEAVLYQKLCECYGEDDVKRNYTSEQYPYACDFYIVSQNLYIELNALWTHGHRWFDAERDAALLQEWSCKHTVYYDNAVHVWSVADVAKRECAKEHALNYVVFWDSKLRDADLWFASGCPNAHDYEREYSWLPVRDIERLEKRNHTGSKRALSSIVKEYQSDVFYKHEIDAWHKNDLFRTMLLQMWLYCNRYEYLGKLPNDLTNRELLRGFTVSGIYKGYTGFDVSLMDEVVKKYNICSVYDPCAGWGERLLYCSRHGLEYHGVDINSMLAPGYYRLIRDFGTGKQFVCFADSGIYIPDFAADAVITCPPYGNIEIYTEYGAENLDEIGFLTWWDKVVANSLQTGCRYFCFQINQRWKERLVGIALQNGLQFVEELNLAVKGSHFTKDKHEYESMVVMRKY